MSSQRMATVTRVTSKIMCAQECLHQVAPPCRTAQYDQGKQSCALFDGYEHEKDTMNGNFTIVFKYAESIFD
ncbi:hypothetical protein DPMN_127369 [Dreissena polymorpha]|uniref:Apple domain-containing protein n=1 Tax=Dreissena polymorpha TaxID=45954 RepID=A0A9D4GZ40_DREPO|nr:hypothetical protein DPMN_127369 [Dreissena polymorpha]